MNRPDWDGLTEAIRELEHEDRMKDEQSPADYPWPIPCSATADDVTCIRARQHDEGCRRTWEDQQQQDDTQEAESPEARALYNEIMVPPEERQRILNEWLAKGGTGPTPPELAVSIPGMDGKEYLRAEKIRQGWDPGIGRWR